jgi:hypothetical protein
MLVAGGAALVGVVCCALGPAAIVGALTTLTVGVVVGWAAAVVVAVGLVAYVVLARRRRTGRPAPPDASPPTGTV